MKPNKILEDLNKIINETQIEYVDEIQAIKEGNYEGEELAKIVLDNLDEFSEQELIEILNNRHYYSQCGGSGLFPSKYDELNGAYPVKLASALSKSKENEKAIKSTSVGLNFVKVVSVVTFSTHIFSSISTSFKSHKYPRDDRAKEFIAG